MPNSPSALKSWILASRPKTWVAGISPVLIGSSMAKNFEWPYFILCLLFSLLVQIGANFSNDFFDFVKGADTSDRIGPPRAVQSGWIKADTLMKGAIAVFALAVIISIPLLVRIGWVGTILMPLTILFALLYTGGKKPLGYIGWGDALVFIFYGPVATIMTHYALSLHFDLRVAFISISPGLLSTAILTANNLRDEKTDRIANKKTLVVRFGKQFGKWEYVTCLLTPFLLPPLLVFVSEAPISWLLPLIALPFSIPHVKGVFNAESGIEFAPLLSAAALQLALFTSLFIAACQLENL